eukprot:364447-Chlamydomonas_euryale.AAC.12
MSMHGRKRIAEGDDVEGAGCCCCAAAAATPTGCCCLCDGWCWCGGRCGRPADELTPLANRRRCAAPVDGTPLARCLQAILPGLAAVRGQ